jgi:glyoxylate reductase
LLSLKNLVITPHLGSATFKTRKRMGEMAIANIRAALKNLPLPFAVKPT